MSKRIVITGASTGIGAATAEHLASGNTVFIHYRSSDQAAEGVKQEVERKGGQAYLVKCDLMTEQGCEHLFGEVSAKTDAVDVLVNSAGGFPERHSVDNLSWELMQHIFALNTFSTMKVSSLFVPLLKKGQSPCIVNITSVAARSGAPTATLYGASKGAIDTFNRGMAKELAPAIRVNAVAPGIVETPFHDKVSTREQLDALKLKTPLQCHGTARLMAETVGLLIENTYMTGATIDVNGGLDMH